MSRISTTEHASHRILGGPGLIDIPVRYFFNFDLLHLFTHKGVQSRPNLGFGDLRLAFVDIKALAHIPFIPGLNGT